MSADNRTVIIDRRFRGPPNSGNGGYTAGLLGRMFDEPAEVTLLAPPPLQTPLTIERIGNEVVLRNGHRQFATARPAAVEIQVPPAPTFSWASIAAANSIDADDHLLPDCFVCGPRRCPGDGLRIFTGPDSSKRFAAATWRPPEEFSDETGRIAPEIIWAALDCPSYFGLMKPGLIALLGQFTVEILHPPNAGQPTVICAWPIDETGRKHAAGSALYDEGGRLFARAKAVWIELKSSVEEQKRVRSSTA